MLFNSYIFLFIFLPITISIFFIFGKYKNKRLPIIWIVFSSLFFYGWWNPIYLLFIIGSMGANYIFGRSILRGYKKKSAKNKYLFLSGITFNLLLLGYFKYANFFIDNINVIFNNDLYLQAIVLPLGISFFTFEQIAYLVDTYRGDSKEYNLWEYCTFVSFFPQLIAGPIAHHNEIIPQLNNDKIYKFDYRNFAPGLTIFFIGLFKKVMIADKLALIAIPVFGSAETGYAITFFEAWIGVLAYTLQIYFDFSGYSDMAIGLGRMFNIKLPYNFNSPYKSTSIIEFWRRWHITLSRFLRDYLYIPLGGNRFGNISRYKNLLLTMFLGGLWHGAGWTFVLWGVLHGVYLTINHLWRQIYNDNYNNKYYTFISWILTMLSIMIAWVFFRAESFSGAINILTGMFGANGFILPEYYQIKLPTLVASLVTLLGVSFGYVSYIINKYDFIMLIVLIFSVLKLPNSQEIVFGEVSYQGIIFKWKPNLLWALFTVLITVFSIMSLNRVSEFLYFQF